jgi:hypothetical protein
LEQLSVVLVGSLLGSIVSYLFPLIDVGTVLMVVVGFIVCYLLGTISALWRLGRISVMKSLCQTD